jgi:hypothetical protein
MNDYKPIAVALTKHKYDDAHAIHSNEVPGHEATVVLHLIEKWGMVAATPDGEDSAGRQKMRLQTPEELVARAMEVTRLAFSTLRENGWLVTIPLPLTAVEDKS